MEILKTSGEGEAQKLKAMPVSDNTIKIIDAITNDQESTLMEQLRNDVVIGDLNTTICSFPVTQHSKHANLISLFKADLYFCVFTHTHTLRQETPSACPRRALVELCVRLFIFLTIRLSVRLFTDTPWL